MICLDGKDDWIFVTKDKGACDWHLEPILFEDAASALDYAQPWIKPGKEHNVAVVNYDNI